jgi:hypothetical protein
MTSPQDAYDCCAPLPHCSTTGEAGNRRVEIYLEL